MNPVTVNLFTGFLGVGKTTALRHLIAHKPADEKWALIVNEFGEVGIDGAVLSGGDVPVAEIAGGCLCCVAGPQMTVTVATLLRRAKPDRLLIEASGLAHAAGVIDELRQPPLAEALTVGAVLTLVDPRQFVDGNYQRQPMYRDQITLADVLVANKIDLADVPTMEAFRRQAAALFPPKTLVAEVREGAVEPGWLKLDNTARRQAYRPPLARDMPSDWQSQGWTFDADSAFDAERLTDFFDTLPTRVPGLQRAKGVFRVMDDWVWLNWTDGQWGATQVAWRRDNRFELIAPHIDAHAVEAALRACQCEGLSA
ncbi:MAG: GTP-binding protein [Paludibacterium sp.]|uniref:CobW family GTP-binding protein n=1 Tax=Paludibacterium sp. TaxID=1917523 RepID=UPI0025EDE24C|nr:GTP-binding protein [Paludibacterium sp.]MBV8048850.1 GTP-binding protein [Paludibacterium sp.]MBV8646493.1 GTP-binding protein [Paludibacterium sp.]